MADITVTLHPDEIKTAILLYLSSKGFASDIKNVSLIDGQSGLEIDDLIAETTKVVLRSER